MCGILGIFRPGGVDRDEPVRLLDLLAHRGPDAADVWFSEDGRLALGQTRLKIIDLSDSANPPMRSADGRWTMVYNGEVVNFAELRARYRGPWQFRTHSDTEVVLATFAEEGTAAMHRWVGMFAFLLLDARCGKLHFARDRFGIKPLYWTRLADGGVAIASEIPPLLKVARRAAADEDTIRTYLETGSYDTGGRTFFAGIHALRPGCAAELDLATAELTERRWYDLRGQVRDLGQADETELIDHGAMLIERAILDHQVSDVPVGLNVSGGVDSSVLVSLSSRTIPDLHVFTQDYEEPYSEGVWVRKVASGARLHLCSLRRDDIEQKLDWTVRRQAEPFGGVTVVGYDSLYREATAEGVTVLLDGNGIDECFLGYAKYLTLRCDATPGGADASLAIDGTVATAADCVTGRLKQDAELLAPSAEGADFEDHVKAAAARDLLVSKTPRALRFNDRMSMGHSKELRVPFLDHRLVEFAFGVPTRHLLARGQTKALFRSIAGRWIPADVANAAKRSVQSPQREWLAGPWQDMVREVLNSHSFAERGWIDPQRAQAAYARYLAGNRDNSFFIWQWLNLELWARAYLD
jgi:asparagine synthase (glutamine-hydrolysing)